LKLAVQVRFHAVAKKRNFNVEFGNELAEILICWLADEALDGQRVWKVVFGEEWVHFDFFEGGSRFWDQNL
jgi:hypothetical protein